MKKNLTAIWIFGIAVIVLFFACNKKSNQAVALSSFSDEQILSEVQPILQSYLDGQYRLATNKSTSTDWQNYQENPSDNTLAKKIIDFKGELEKIGFVYTDFTSQISIDSLKRKNDSVLLKINHDFTLTTNDKDMKTGEFIVSEGGRYYNVVMKYKNSIWVISNFSYHEWWNPWYVNLDPPIGTFPTEENRTNRKQDDLPVFIPYKSDNAVNYAYKHWNSPSVFYCDFKEYGDCTNFLSQCLMAGDWQQRSKWWSSGISCCNNLAGCVIQNCYSCSWTVAHSFYKYITKTNRIEKGCFVDSDLWPGNIMQFDLNSDGSIDHSALVTKRTGNGKNARVYVTYRNSANGKPEKDMLSSLLGGVHYGWQPDWLNAANGDN